MLDGAPEVGIGYERAFFETVHSSWTMRSSDAQPNGKPDHDHTSNAVTCGERRWHSFSVRKSRASPGSYE
jgi:hypothetical protein